MLKRLALITTLSIGVVYSFLTLDESDAKQKLSNLGSDTEAVNSLNDLNAYDELFSGDFQPTKSVTRSESAKILYNLYNNKLKKVRTYNNNFSDINKNTKYYKEIVWTYEVGIFDGSKTNNKLYYNPNSNLTRGQMAKILTETFKIPYYKEYTFKDSNHKLWFGKYVSTIYGVGVGKGTGNTFVPNSNVNRSNFSTFVNNLNKLDGKFTHIPNLIQPNYQYKYITGNEQLSWLQYTTDYKKFSLVGINSKNQKVAEYTSINGTTINNIKIGSDNIATTRNKLGEPLTSIRKHNNVYTISSIENVDMFLVGKNYITVFYDKHNLNLVRAISVIDVDVELSKVGFYGKNINGLEKSSEDLMFQLINQSRVSNGLKALTYDKKNNYVAKNHSIDMVKNNYFSHSDLKGNRLDYRIKNAGINYLYAGENLAYGHFDMLYSHHALMNSLGHRNNILSSKYNSVIVGVYNKSDGSPYVTTNFYTLK